MPPTTSYADRLKTAAAASVAAGAGGSTTRDQAAELAVFRHSAAPRFGTSRSAVEDTYYDEDRDVEPACSDDYNDGWNVVDRKKAPTTKSKINYAVDLTDEDYLGCGGAADDDAAPNNSW